MPDRTALRLVPATVVASNTPDADPLLRTALDAFYAEFSGETLRNYRYDVRIFLDWCSWSSLVWSELKRPDMRRFVLWLQEPARNRGKGYAQASIQRRVSTVKSFYQHCVLDELLDKDPTIALKLPKIDGELQRRTFLEPLVMGRWLAAAREHSPTALALGVLMGECGLRVSTACSLDIERLTVVRGWDAITFVDKGPKTRTIPLPVPVMRIVRDAIGDRTAGPILTNRDGNRLNRSSAARLVTRVAKDAGITQDLSPHSFRRTMITTALHLGVPVHKVSHAAGHANLATTMIYNRFDGFDDHATHAVAGFYSQLGG